MQSVPRQLRRNLFLLAMKARSGPENAVSESTVLGWAFSMTLMCPPESVPVHANSGSKAADWVGLSRAIGRLVDAIPRSWAP